MRLVRNRVNDKSQLLQGGYRVRALPEVRRLVPTHHGARQLCARTADIMHGNADNAGEPAQTLQWHVPRQLRRIRWVRGVRCGTTRPHAALAAGRGAPWADGAL